MSVYWNERVKNLLPYVPGEQPRNRKFIKLNTNENPYPPSPKVIEAIGQAAGEGLGRYPDPACTEFREAVAARWGIRPEQVFPGNGSDEVLAFAFAAFFGISLGPGRDAPGAALLFPDITYSFYPVYAGLWNVPYRTVPLEPDFSINPGGYLGPSGGVIFPNPNAPTGMALPLEDIKRIAAAQEKNRRVFIVDEAYIAFAGGGEGGEAATSALSLIKNFPNLLVVHTLSKSASLAGLRAGFAVGSEELIEGLCRVRDSFNSYTLDRLALAGGAAAVLDTAYYDEINRRIVAVRQRTAAELRGLGFRVLPSQANFLFAAPPLSGGKSGAEFFAALRERGILVRHFNKPRIADYLRISIGTGEDMDALLEASREILKTWV